GEWATDLVPSNEPSHLYVPDQSRATRLRRDELVRVVRSEPEPDLPSPGWIGLRLPDEATGRVDQGQSPDLVIVPEILVIADGDALAVGRDRQGHDVPHPGPGSDGANGPRRDVDRLHRRADADDQGSPL